MKKTLYFYLCKEITVPFLLGMTIFTFVLLMGRLMKLTDLVVAKGVPFSDVIRLVLYLLPYFSLVTIPMAFLLALLLAFGRLSADSEVTALKACGTGLYNLLPPVISYAVAAYAATTLIAVYGVPWGNTSFRHLLHDTIGSRVNLTIKEAVFNDDFPGMVLYVDRFDKDRGVMSGILIQDDRNPEQPTTIFAESGRLDVNPEKRIVHLELTNGSIHRSLDKKGYRKVEFRDYALTVSLERKNGERTKDESDMTLGELRENLKSLSGTPKMRLDMAVELHRRFALPFACLVFAVVGVPLGVQNQRSGKAAGFAVSIAVILLYYLILAAGKSLGERGIIPPAAAVWTPNALFLFFGVHLFRQAAAERRFFLFALFSGFFRRCRRLSGKRRSRS